jgi:hypothetical protein
MELGCSGRCWRSNRCRRRKRSEAAEAAAHDTDTVSRVVTAERIRSADGEMRGERSADVVATDVEAEAEESEADADADAGTESVGTAGTDAAEVNGLAQCSSSGTPGGGADSRLGAADTREVSVVEVIEALAVAALR